MADTVRGKLVIDTQMQIDSARKQIADLQKYLDKLTIPNNLKNRFTSTFTSLNKEFSKLETKMQGSLKTKGDLGGLEKTTQAVERLYENLTNLTAKTGNLGDSIFGNIHSTEIDTLDAKIKQIGESLKNFSNVPGLTKLETEFRNSSTASDTLKSKVEAFIQAFRSGDFSNAEKIRNEIAKTAKGYETLKTNTGQVTAKQQEWINALKSVDQVTDEYNNSVTNLNNELQSLSGQRDQAVQNALNKQRNGFKKVSDAVKDNENKLRQNNKALIDSVRSMVSFETQAQYVASSIGRIFSITGVATAFRKIIRDAINDVKELDEAMTSIAVVTNFSINDLWGQVDKYSKLAQQKGVELKGVYDVQKLYYQQGRNAEDVEILTNNTLEFARIAELDYAAATDAMTVAINAFNLKAKDSIRIVDIYSNLAAKAAVDQSELANAMSKVASMASSVGMSLETTSAFLTQIIETTREAPETAGTALKTVLARFGEVKKLIDTGKSTGTTDEGEEIDVNKIDTALKTVGVRLTDTNGQMRALDKVIIELAEKWNSLDSMTQRYLATMAAGSRQQSRFLALMSNSERLTELLGEAYNSAGAGAAQFAKTQESLQSKINNLKTAWTQFTTSVLNSKLLKGAVDTLTFLLNTVNAITDALGPLSGAAKLAAISFTLIGGGQKIQKLFSGKLASGLVKAGELFRTGKIDGEEYQAGFESGRTITETAGSGKRSIKQIAEARIKGAQLGIEEATAREKADEQIHEMMEAWGVPREVAEAKQKGKIKGLAEERAKQEAMGSLEGLSLPRQLAFAYQQGKMSGGSWKAGFSEALATFKASSLFTKFLAPIGAALPYILIPAAVVGLLAVIDNWDKIVHDWKEKNLKNNLEESESLKQQYESEIASLEAQDNLTAGEKARLNYLKEQTKELEKQIKLQKGQTFENDVEYRDSQEHTVQYQEVTVGGKTVLSKHGLGRGGKTVTGDEALVDETLATIDRLRKEQAKNTQNDEYYNQLEGGIQEQEKILQEVYDFYSNNFDNITDPKHYEILFKAAEGLGKDTNILSIFDEESYNKIVELNEQGALTDDALKNIAQDSEVLQAYLNATGATARDFSEDLKKINDSDPFSAKISGYKKAAEELKNIKTSVSAITDAISGIYKDGYADIEKISTIANNEAFADLDSFPEFLDLISKAGKEDIPQLEDAMENLLDEYMASDGVLSSLNETTKGMYINALNNMGVTNAQEVVEEKLYQVRAKNLVLSMDENEISQILKGTNEDVSKSLGQLAKDYNTTEKNITAYLIKQKFANENPLSTAQSRTELTKLVKTLGIAADATSEYGLLMKTIQDAQYGIQTRQIKANLASAKGTEAGNLEALAYLKEIEILQNKGDVYQNRLSEYLDGEIEKIVNVTTPQVDTTNLDKISSKSEKEIQKLYELYNAKKKLAAIEEKIKDLEEENNILQDYDSRLENENKMVEAYKEEQQILQTLINQNEQLRQQKLAEGKQWSKYFEVDDITHQLIITKAYYDEIKKSGNKTSKTSAEILNNFKKWAEEYEDIVEFSREQENSINSINSKLLELWYQYRSDYVDLVNQLADLYEQAQQKIIDDQKDAYDKLKEQDDNYLDELRKNIEARRKARDRENDVEEIVKKQKRLAMLMRDSSGRNAGEIADLQKEIQNAQQDVIDEDIDRVIDSMEEANDKQQENWDNVIDKLQEQLDQDKENGKFIRLAEQKFEEGPEAVMEAFKGFFQTTGPYSQAEIDKKLQEILNILPQAFKYFNGENPAENPGGTGNKSYTPTKYLDPQGNIQQGYISTADNKTYKDTELTERIDQGSIVYVNGKAYKLVGDNGVDVTSQLTDAQKKLLRINTGGQGTPSSNTNTNTTTSRAKVANTGGKGVNLRSGPGKNYEKIGAYSDGTTVTVLDESNSAWWKVKVGNATGYMASQYLKKYLNGGLVDFTGPAWVDGSKSAPEAFLDAQDTRNFAQLKDILASLLRADRFKANEVSPARGGDCTIYVTVDQIASDYDVDEAVARIKQEIMSGSAYRNINLVNRHR